VSLLKSTYRRIQNITLQVGRVGGGFNNPDRITLSTFHSILNANIEKCDILLVDEVHRLPAFKFSKDIAMIRNAVKTFGMTATPMGRADGAELVAQVIVGPKLCEVDYDEAAAAGIVADISVNMLSLPACAVTSSLWSSKVARKRNLYWRNEVRNTLFADAMKDAIASYSYEPQALILAETTEHAFRMKQLLPDFEVIYGSLSKERRTKLLNFGLITSDYVPLTTKAKDRALDQFEKGELKRVIATGCWGEGVDFVYLDILANVSGTASPITTIQWSGRNSRLHDKKTAGLVIDCSDKWDLWSARRASIRNRVYRSKGWNISHGNVVGKPTISTALKQGDTQCDTPTSQH
jgi:superfamily II DNA or RNA helicase